MSVFDDRRDRAATTPPVHDPYQGCDDTVRDLAVRLRAVEDKLLLAVGVDGTNGRVGNLRKEVDGHSGALKWLMGVAAASVVTAVAAIYGAGQKDGSNEQEKQYQHAAIERLQRKVEALEGIPPAYRFPANPLTGDDR
jgi:wobble nucleotide-excising tRNase